MEIFEAVQTTPAKDLEGFNFIFEVEKTSGKKRLTLTDGKKSVSSVALDDLKLLRDDDLDYFTLKIEKEFRFTEQQKQAVFRDIERIKINQPMIVEKATEKVVSHNLKSLSDTYLHSGNPEGSGIEKALPSQISNIILAGYQIKTLEETNEILIYSKGVYLAGGESYISRIIETNFEKHYVTNHVISEVFGHIRRSTYAKREEFDVDPFIINVKNALVNIKTREVKEHTPEYLSRIQLPIEYNPDAKCREIPKFLREVMPDSNERTLLFEQAAYTLVRNTRQQKAFMYVGDGANGKTTWLNVVERFLGTQNIANISLQKLAGNRFAAAGLETRLANIYSDISDLEMKETGIIKSIITGDPIDVERKGRDSYTLRPYAKLFYCANKLPEVNNDQSYAFYRRWIINEFNQRFEGASDDKHILDRLTTPEELSGLLNILVPIAYRLENGGDFSNAPTTEEIREIWGEKSNIIKAFLADQTIKEADAVSKSIEVYQAYIDWCKVKNYTPKSSKVFVEKLRLEGIQPSVKKMLGKSTRVLLGCQLKVTPVTGVTRVHYRTFEGTGEQVIEGVTGVTGVTGEAPSKPKIRRFKNPIPEDQREVHTEGLKASASFFEEQDIEKEKRRQQLEKELLGGNKEY